MIQRDVLVREHAAIAAVAEELLHHAAARPPCVATLARVRWQLGRLLLAHLAVEDKLLYPWFQNSGSAEVADLSRRFEREMGGLAETVRAFMTHWGGDRIAGDPDGFERDAHAIVTALSHRIHREETQLYHHIPAARTVDGGPRRA